MIESNPQLCRLNPHLNFLVKPHFLRLLSFGSPHPPESTRRKGRKGSRRVAVAPSCCQCNLEAAPARRTIRRRRGLEFERGKCINEPAPEGDLHGFTQHVDSSIWCFIRKQLDFTHKKVRLFYSEKKLVLTE